MLLYSLWYAVFSDVIPLNGGFGLEGAYFYKAVVLDCYQAVVVRVLNAYSIQRILPFALAHYVPRLLHLPLTDSVVFRCFILYNALLGGIICLFQSITQGHNGQLNVFIHESSQEYGNGPQRYQADKGFGRLWNW